MEIYDRNTEPCNTAKYGDLPSYTARISPYTDVVKLVLGMIYCYNFLILLTMPIAKSSKTKDQLLLSGYRYRRANKSQIIWLCC
ncbi:unnamed protein product [Rotaria socialis]